MVTWNPTENCVVTTYHPSFLVCWRVPGHSGYLLGGWGEAGSLLDFLFWCGGGRGGPLEGIGAAFCKKGFFIP
jgi:hypothetical protein